MTEDLSLPFTRAFHALDALRDCRNARGYWGAARGRGGLVVCTIWSDQFPYAYIPAINKGGYKDAALALEEGALVHVIARDRTTDRATPLPTVLRVSQVSHEARDNHVGFLCLSHTPFVVG